MGRSLTIWEQKESLEQYLFRQEQVDRLNRILTILEDRANWLTLRYEFHKDIEKLNSQELYSIVSLSWQPIIEQKATTKESNKSQEVVNCIKSISDIIILLREKIRILTVLFDKLTKSEKNLIGD